MGEEKSTALAHKLDRSLVEKIQDNVRDKNSSRTDNKAKGLINREYINAHKAVILESLKKGITIRDIYTQLNSIVPMRMAERTFYRLCNNLNPMSEEEKSFEKTSLSDIKNIVKEPKEVNVNNQEPSNGSNELVSKKDTDRPVINKTFQHNPNSSADDLVG